MCTSKYKLPPSIGSKVHPVRHNMVDHRYPLSVQKMLHHHTSCVRSCSFKSRCCTVATVSAFSRMYISLSSHTLLCVTCNCSFSFMICNCKHDCWLFLKAALPVVVLSGVVAHAKHLLLSNTDVWCYKATYEPYTLIQSTTFSSLWADKVHIFATFLNY